MYIPFLLYYIICKYVDDLIKMGNDIHMIHNLKEDMKKTLKCQILDYSIITSEYKFGKSQEEYSFLKPNTLGKS